ncbi:unnamed protein product [Gulo gulo]|uniref:Uncharacterized protein n=1 Tax=Gulo gulo TaxID=48420 RepID=A0A9X9Q477_GULGU|nr:unnamed protein product [Gulo gulo]
MKLTLCALNPLPVVGRPYLYTPTLDTLCLGFPLEYLSGIRLKAWRLYMVFFSGYW